MTRFDCDIYAANDMRVSWGTNEGDPLGRPDECTMGDIYMLDPSARAVAVTLDLGPPARVLTVAPGTAPQGDGAPVAGAAVMAQGILRLMATDGDLLEAVVLGIGRGLFVLPLSPMRAGVGYALIAHDTTGAALRLTQAVQGCLGSGTRITLGDGSLRPIEDLRPGDMVLTRDNGPQPLRWAGKVTLRAFGNFAPVIFAPGALGNLGPLTVAPLQRIFLYQRGDRALGPRAEVLIQAQYLADGTRAQRREGGFVTYHSLAFDAHQIVYAEGVPAESLLVSRATLAQLPDGLALDLQARFPRLDQHAHFARAGSADQGAIMPARA